MAMTIEQKVQIRGMAIDLALRAGTLPDNLTAKAQELYDFILKDQEEALAKQLADARAASLEKVVKLV